ncbi:MAG: hypothetical protein JWO06_3759 [Bacteroidota bacterium]|nr:hypothetical protein [Bacteroidota bacterium]
MHSLKSFFSDPSNLFQLTGGLIALTAAIFGTFYKDTVIKGTYKLTGWGWAVLFFLFLGALINSSSKFYDFKKERMQSVMRDSVQHMQDSIRDLQVAKLVTLTRSLDTLKDTSIANYNATSASFKSSLKRLTVINDGVEDALQVVSSVKFPLSNLSFHFEFDDGIDSADLQKLAPVLYFIDEKKVSKNPKLYDLNNPDFYAGLNTISSTSIYEARIQLRSKFIPDKESIRYSPPDYLGYYQTRIFYQPNLFSAAYVQKTNRIKSLDNLGGMKIFLLLQSWDIKTIPKIVDLVFFYNDHAIPVPILKTYQYKKSILVLESIFDKSDLDFLHNSVN